MVFLDFLGIDQFVWARVFCELRIGCCAPVDCSGVARKIHTRKIKWYQGIAWIKIIIFMPLIQQLLRVPPHRNKE